MKINSVQEVGGGVKRVVIGEIKPTENPPKSQLDIVVEELTKLKLEIIDLKLKVDRVDLKIK